MRTASVLVLFAFVGCNDERVAKLEKQTAALELQLAQTQKSGQLELQAKCGKDAKIWFDQNWQPDKDTILLTYTNHYSTAKNKCFINIEFHYNLGAANNLSNYKWYNNVAVHDVYENNKYGEISETHGLDETKVTACLVYGKKCNTMQEYQSLVAQFMNN